MERNIRDAERVLVVCTEEYVRKADQGVGGAGYEAMIVTGELVRNLGSEKFIPIVRKGSGEVMVPRSLSTRSYIDLRKDSDAEFERLLRELHQVPAPDRPALGKSPFTVDSPVSRHQRSRRVSARAKVLKRKTVKYPAAK